MIFILGPEDQLGENYTYLAGLVRLEWWSLAQEYAGGCVSFSAFSWDRGRLKMHWLVQKCAPNWLTSYLACAISHNLASALLSHISPTSLHHPLLPSLPCSTTKPLCHSLNMWPTPLWPSGYPSACPVSWKMPLVGAYQRRPLGIWKYKSSGGWRDGYIRELKVEGFSLLFRVFSKSKNLDVIFQRWKIWSDLNSWDYSSPTLSSGDMFQEPQWMPKSMA